MCFEESSAWLGRGCGAGMEDSEQAAGQQKEGRKGGRMMGRREASCTKSTKGALERREERRGCETKGNEEMKHREGRLRCLGLIYIVVLFFSSSYGLLFGVLIACLLVRAD